MPLSAEGLRRLAALNLSGEALAEVLAVVADAIAPDDERRRRDRERKATSRGKSADIPADIPRTVHGISADSPPSEVSPIDNHKPLPTTPIPSASRLSDSPSDPPKPKRISAESDERLLDGVSDIWNAWAAAHGCPQVAHLTGSRAIHCRRRIAELMAHGHQTAAEAFRFLLRHCDDSFFVKGSPRKPLEFNQLLKEDFVARMIEGSFKFQPKPAGARQWAS